MIKAMSHIGISVANLDRSINFYRDLLGMDLVSEGVFEGERYSAILGLDDAAGRMASLRSADLEIELFEFSRPAAQHGSSHRRICDQGISHFCIEVADIESEHRRLKALGVAFHCAPLQFPGSVKATYGRDPDGNVFELLQRS